MLLSWVLTQPSVAIPIIYENRAYLPPRRLRALTTNDALNPGWRTIRLTGGASLKATPTSPEPGVEVTLLLPSPPILFIPHDGVPPPIPFHLHFHSDLPLPLTTFSDPNECTFLIRLMRVTMIRISTEREIRRMEMKSRTEVWQEGGARISVGRPGPTVRTQTSANGRGSTNASTPAAPATAAAQRSNSSNDRRRPFSELAPSFLRRRSSNDTPEPPQVASANAANVAAIPVIEEEPPSPPPEPSDPMVPLSLDATDVHLLGQLTLNPPTQGLPTFRTLLQSFSTPEMAISYVLEVGIQPKKGAVKEAFSHIWGGGLVEVVLGSR